MTYKRLLVIIALPLVSFGICSFLLRTNAPQLDPGPLATTASQTPNDTAARPPARLEIPSIRLDATVKPTSLTPDGSMAVDDSIVDVAWYMRGPKPGETGSAVIAGHYGWKNGVASVFNEIQKLKQGDEILVHDGSGGTESFIVQNLKKYEPTADTREVFQSSDGKAHLNLITCNGQWNEASQSYTERLVVFTNKVN